MRKNGFAPVGDRIPARLGERIEKRIENTGIAPGGEYVPAGVRSFVRLGEAIGKHGMEI